MLLEIDDYKTIGDLQERFEESFPKLTIQFFGKAHHWQEKTAIEPLPAETKIGDIRKLHNPGILEIRSTFKCGKVEKDFERLFGLHIQILFHHNGKWHQTTQADTYTLQELSEGNFGELEF